MRKYVSVAKSINKFVFNNAVRLDIRLGEPHNVLITDDRHLNLLGKEGCRLLLARVLPEYVTACAFKQGQKALQNAATTLYNHIPTELRSGDTRKKRSKK